MSGLNDFYPATGGGGPSEFDCVVDAAGNGDFTDFLTAWAAGNRYIGVKAGTYVITSDLLIDQTTEDLENTKYGVVGLDFGVNLVVNTPSWCLMNTDDNIWTQINKADTADAPIVTTAGSNLITTTGDFTTWVSSDGYVLQPGMWFSPLFQDYGANANQHSNIHRHKIVSIDSANQITLDSDMGVDSSGIDYDIQQMTEHVHFENFTISRTVPGEEQPGLLYTAGIGAYRARAVNIRCASSLAVADGDMYLMYNAAGRSNFWSAKNCKGILSMPLEVGLGPHCVVEDCDIVRISPWDTAYARYIGNTVIATSVIDNSWGSLFVNNTLLFKPVGDQTAWQTTACSDTNTFMNNVNAGWLKVADIAV